MKVKLVNCPTSVHARMASTKSTTGKHVMLLDLNAYSSAERNERSL